MALGGQVSDHLGAEVGDGRPHGLGVADIGLDKAVAIGFRGGFERAEQARIGQLVQH
jgi:hypothetical protein